VAGGATLLDGSFPLVDRIGNTLRIFGLGVLRRTADNVQVDRKVTDQV
jgi:hypothetical protein